MPPRRVLNELMAVTITTQKIVLMRHGHAEPPAARDRERQLTERGRRASRAQAELITEFLASGSRGIGAIYHSPFVRTSQTAHELGEALQLVRSSVAVTSAPDLHPEDQLLGDNAAQGVLNWIEQRGIQNAVLISHQPLVSLLLALLVDADISNNHAYSMAPASVALLEFEVAAQGCFTLQKLVHV